MGHTCSALHMEGCPPGPLGHTSQVLARTLGMALTQPPSALGSGWRHLRQETVLVVFIPEMLSQRGTPKSSAVSTPPLSATEKAGCRSPGEMNPASVRPHLRGSWLARSQHRDAVVPRHALTVPPWRVPCRVGFCAVSAAPGGALAEAQGRGRVGDSGFLQQ